MSGLTVADELLVLQLCAVNEGWPMDAGGRVWYPSGTARAAAGALLAELGALGRLGNAGDPRHVFVPEGGPEFGILKRCRRALHGGRGDERTVALLALMRATGLHERWFREYAPAEVDARILSIVGGRWYGSGVPHQRSWVAAI